MSYRLLLIKRKVEDAVMYPLILIGRLIARLRPESKEYRIFFFFPFYHTGGAEKVHSLVAQAAGGSDCIIYFTKRSANTTFLQKFATTGCAIKDVSRYTDNKWLYFLNIIFRGIISERINAQSKQPVVFNGQCNFGYKVSPWVRRNIRQIELIHSVSNFSFIRIPFLPFITCTVMISRKKIAEHLAIYRRYGIPPLFDGRINYIPNATEFGGIDLSEKQFDTTTVFYSGRATPEKRSHLVVAIAKAVHAIEPAIQFLMAGDDFNDFRTPDTAFIAFKGNIADENELQQLYAQSQILLITSSTEGFPLAVIEGMMYGNAILATPVGDIPSHITPPVNGRLFSSISDEQVIIQEGVKYILDLHYNRERLKQVAETNMQYAKENFGFSNFAQAYRKIIAA